MGKVENVITERMKIFLSFQKISTEWYALRFWVARLFGNPWQLQSKNWDIEL